MIVTGDFNGEFGNGPGDKGRKLPNDQGKVLLDFANTLNICPVNLLDLCEGPLEPYNSHCGRYCSTLDYILLPYCLLDKIVSAKTFELNVDNTSDHLLILMELTGQNILRKR